MRHRVLTFALFLLLGAAMSIVVAGACLMSRGGTMVSMPVSSDAWLSEAVGQVPPQTFMFVKPSFGVDRCEYFEGGFFGLAAQVRAGIPVRCLTGGVVYESEYSQFRAISAIPIGASSSFFSLFPDHFIPSSIVWPGFAINTLFYAVIAWLLIRGPFALRRRVRAKRGRCIACGYDLRGQAAASDRCPECGSAHAPSPQPSPSEGEGAKPTRA